MSTERNRVKVSFTADERTRVDALADQLRLSVSELLRRLALGARLPDPADFVAARAIGDLLKVNADQARLGNLLKLALDVGAEDLSPAHLARIEGLLAEISTVQTALKATVHAIHYQQHPRAKQPE